MQRLEQGVARELGHEIAGEPADRAEGRCARAGRAGAALVVVAMAYDADPVAARKGVMQEPFERAPGRMHLHRALEPAVMGIVEVRIAPADMRNDDGILAVERVE